MRIFILIFVSVLCSKLSWAQPPKDSIAMLAVVDITANKLMFLNNIDIQHFSTKKIANYSSQSMDNILNDYAGINIKSYGYGGMSNAAIRGGNSYHTAVIWNGINLQDPLNGGFNLSLFPLFFTNDITISKGGSSALFGSGAMGGSIHLSNKMEFNKGIGVDILASAASFSNYQFGGGISFSNANISSILKIYNKTAKNNFPFINTEEFGNPLTKQQNAAENQFGILQENMFIINKHQKINTALWYQHNNQEVPTAMNASKSQSRQENSSLRGQLKWKYYNKNQSFSLRNSILTSSLLYEDNISNIRALHRSFSNISEAEYRLKIRQSDIINVGLINTFEKANSDELKTELNKNPQQNRTAIFVSYKAVLRKNITVNSNIRKEYITNRFTPFTFSTGINWRFYKSFTANISISKNYRVPTFNDLYWSDAMAKGNPLLKDESSINSEIGIQWNSVNNLITLGINTYSTEYYNLIQWVPENAIWSPENKKAVWARGIESSISFDKKINKLTFSMGGILTLSKSTIVQKNDNESDDILNKQLVLAPKINGNTNLKITYQSFSIEYILKYMGKRFITSDNLDYLNAYQLSDIVISKDFSIQQHKLALMLRFNNIWNEVYVSMPSYAMPLVNYELSLRMYLTKKKP